MVSSGLCKIHGHLPVFIFSLGKNGWKAVLCLSRFGWKRGIVHTIVCTRRTIDDILILKKKSCRADCVVRCGNCCCVSVVLHVKTNHQSWNCYLFKQCVPGLWLSFCASIVFKNTFHLLIMLHAIQLRALIELDIQLRYNESLMPFFGWKESSCALLEGHIINEIVKRKGYFCQTVNCRIACIFTCQWETKFYRYWRL